MSESAVSSVPYSEFAAWEKIRDKKINGKRFPFSLSLEITARCNNNCRHCYINLPAGDRAAKEKELSFEEIKEIIDEAVSLGTIGCLITGGEPLLRQDFSDIYMYIKKKGLLVGVFTNACLIADHIELFKKYPPRDIEVSVYGVTKETYERITRKPGSFDAFMRGLDLLLQNGIKVRFKTMALHSNLHEMSEIARFCRERTKDYFRFDPVLHLGYGLDPVKNEEIRSEMLSPEEVVELEQSDPDRMRAMEKKCDRLIQPEFEKVTSSDVFTCGAGNSSFSVGWDGFFRLCLGLIHPDCIYDLRKGSLTDAWNNFVPRIRCIQSEREEFLKTCRTCPVINLCTWCPANAYLETGELDLPVDRFCQIANARAEALTQRLGLKAQSRPLEG